MAKLTDGTLDMVRYRLRREVQAAMPPGVTLTVMERGFDVQTLGYKIALKGDILGHPFEYVCADGGDFLLSIDGKGYAEGKTPQQYAAATCGDHLRAFAASLPKAEAANDPAPTDLKGILTGLVVHLRQAADALERMAKA